ncbi:hypothetical protein DNK59_28540 [Pseudomonas sp. TKO26]|uniref:hypothetical protein n=1 Tax=unclassified Pseudomonas TaxID=196821 RepID=UPI000D825D1A|nr:MULTISPECIES: hypothetical protein [unclassified Pseudomonas]PYY78787.1 hypothetical protein DNK62_28540 [Pseudomonas sp. TKO30]PYY79880.1 hypothetical protein DNK61_27915 [Pseudomonas sp. TKO29]PYY81746.1 hypothetical protein DNK59_28540 [Pseudomonas sp. TKO26]PYY98870.1 hypothetical protein DNK60_18555 [Pseudomonas sp. TKO14]
MKNDLNKPYFAPMVFWLALICVLALVYGFGPAEVPELIYLSLEPACLLVAFAFMYYFFCWSFISVWRLGEIGWKRVDYGWLLLASLALISATQAVRVDWFQSDYQLAQQAQAALQRRLATEIDDMLGGEHCKAAAERYEPQDAAQVMSLCERFAALERGPDGRLSALAVIKVQQALGDIRGEYTAPPISQWLQGLSGSIKELEQQRAEVHRLNGLVAVSDTEKLYSYFVPLLLVIALALRASKVTGEVLLKAPRRRKLWLIVNRRVIIDGLGFARGARARLDEALGNWRVARWGVVHLGCDFIGAPGPQDTPIPVSPGFYENEFRLETLAGFDGSEFVQWAATQTIDILYLVGETDQGLIERLRRWGEALNIEVLVRERI